MPTFQSRRASTGRLYRPGFVDLALWPRHQPVYIVVFRSRRAPEADGKLLMEHDERAHREAQKSTSLLYYFGGHPDTGGYCVSFCLWTSPEGARAATRREPHHRAAVGLAASMYTHFTLERYWLHRDGGQTVITPYEES